MRNLFEIYVKNHFFMERIEILSDFYKSPQGCNDFLSVSK